MNKHEKYLMGIVCEASRATPGKDLNLGERVRQFSLSDATCRQVAKALFTALTKPAPLPEKMVSLSLQSRRKKVLKALFGPQGEAVANANLSYFTEEEVATIGDGKALGSGFLESIRHKLLFVARVRLEKILKGYVKSEAANFFAEQWQSAGFGKMPRHFWWQVSYELQLRLAEHEIGAWLEALDVPDVAWRLKQNEESAKEKATRLARDEGIKRYNREVDRQVALRGDDLHRHAIVNNVGRGKRQ